MNKKQLINKTVEVLKNNNVRKRISSQKTVLHVSDDDGNSKDFVIKKSPTGLLFTSGDVTAVIDACLNIIEDALLHGEEVSLHGFGTFEVSKMKEKQIKHPETGEPITLKERYVPKFHYGNNLRMAALSYGLTQQEKECDAE